MDPHIACAELYLRLGDDDVLILDCRSVEAWEQTGFHIPGALRMTAEEIARDLTMLPDDELIVLCGCDPDGDLALRLCRLLLLRGRNAVCLEGGMEAWVEEGFPIEPHLCEMATALHP